MRLTFFTAAFFLALASANDILLTNDDGWAVAMIRAQNDALIAAGHNVVLSAPAQDESGTGSESAPPTVLTEECEFDTCPIGSPPEGFNTSNPRLNFVNSFPVDAVRFGIQTLSPEFFGGQPDFVVSGPNVGNNLGLGVLGSGTVGAACEAALEGIPSTAFSAATAAHVSFTTLDSDPTSQDTLAALTYSTLTERFLSSLLAGPTPVLPPVVTINVNYPSTDNCSDASAFQFVATRLVSDPIAVDFPVCGKLQLPAETDVVQGPGCFVSVSVMSAIIKLDVDPVTQGLVFDRLKDLLTCVDD